MGKAIRWLRTMLGMKKEKDAENSNSPAGDKKEKNRWSFSKSGKNFSGTGQTPVAIPSNKTSSDADWRRSYLAKSGEEQSKQAIAVAAASAAAADAAVAAAQAAVAVVRLTNRRGGALFNGAKEILAALKIQNVFRGYLARKALRALKGLVKLQALVRGYLVRKRAAATFQGMQALIRAQTAVRAQRARRSHNKENKLVSEIIQPKKSMDDFRWLNVNDTENPKIVEIDTFKRRSGSRRFTSLLPEFGEDRPYYSTMASPARFSTPNCRQIQDFEWCLDGEECRILTAHNTPRMMNSGWPNGGWTPAKSVCGDGYFRPFSNFPNYMASTQSFKAKLRSRSAPKQRPDVWSKKRLALNEIMGPRNSMSSVKMQRSCDRIGEEVIDF